MRRVLGATVCALSMSFAMHVPAWSGAPGGGTQRWTASYQYGAAAFTNAVTLSPDGSTVFVTGISNFGPSGRFATLAYDAATGDRAWAATFPGAASGEYGMGKVLTVSPDGSTLFVSGFNRCTSGCDASSFEGFTTLAYDAATGERRWTSRLDSSGGSPTSLQVSPDGSAVFLAATDGNQGSELVAYDAATGQQRWMLDREKAVGYYGGGLAVSADGATVFVTDTAPPDYVDCFDSGGYRTTAFDAATGNVGWSSTYTLSGGGTICGTPTDLGVSPDGSTVYVTGYGSLTPQDHSGRYQSGTVAYDASTGTQKWAVTDDDIRVLDGDTVVSLGVDPDGSRVFVSGDGCADYPSCSFTTLALDASTGGRQWLSKYDGGGRGYANDLAVSPDGSSVFITGQETLPCFEGCTFSQINAPLVAYDATTGAEQWATTYTDNLGRALAVSPDGSSVYLAGTFTAAGSTTRRAGAPSSRACRDRCGYSTARYNTGPGPGTYQDSDPSLRYDGWRGFFHKSAIGGAYRASNVTGDNATFRTPAVGRLSWLTHQGPNQGKAAVVIDGHAQGTFDLYARSPSARSISLNRLGRHPHVVKVRVLGRKRASSTGSWVAIDGFAYRSGSGIAQESSAKLQYDSWTATATSAARGGTLRQTATRGASVRLEFAGRGISWITATGPGFGRARVAIDGKKHVVNLNAAARRWGVPISFSGLGRGRHQISITCLGNKRAPRSTNLVVDALVVRR